MLLTLFLLLVLVSMLHFVYEGIILPSMRLKNRIRLFKLRDRLRRLKIDDPDLDDRAFSSVQQSLNFFVQKLYMIDVPYIIACNEAIERSPELKEVVKKRRDLIENANSPELKEIVNEIFSTVKQTAIANNGMWAIYLTPIVLVFSGVRTFAEALKKMACVSERELDNLPINMCPS
jgi:hypothetical protein